MRPKLAWGDPCACAHAYGQEAGDAAQRNLTAALVEEVLLRPYDSFSDGQSPAMESPMNIRQVFVGAISCLRGVLGEAWPQAVCLLDASVEERVRMLSLSGKTNGILAVLHNQSHWALLAFARHPTPYAVLYDSLRKPEIRDQAKAVLCLLADSSLASTCLINICPGARVCVCVCAGVRLRMLPPAKTKHTDVSGPCFLKCDTSRCVGQNSFP